ncbi:bacteriophage Gp15 family protein [Clostridium cellulovorans]|uniref:Bacteriophage Gp15 protein n=1 Tax=Clostridium cellulovorans (strain ATCC 35296 / DSM 3052 / OCM 3 / 743B) TaxID=573061 RepID=D9SVZ9_CLOC7|nr:bacteriophage Gp15 family protein [Clostridium cellulovorans]ADL53210.1 putative protein GP15 [Clostridium cellulovorans 743B]
MNILIDLLPAKVRIDGVEYEINSDFRTSILFEIMMQDRDLDDKSKIVQALDLYYSKIPCNVEKAIDEILWFYKCGKEEDSLKAKGNLKAVNIYSYDYDAEYIYSAFLDQYGVDLQDIEFLHWWKFKAMFKSLKEDNEIVKIMGYRAIDISKIKDKAQREHYKKLKEMYKIPSVLTKDEKEKLDAIREALSNSKNVDNVL